MPDIIYSHLFLNLQHLVRWVLAMEETIDMLSVQITVTSESKLRKKNGYAKSAILHCGYLRAGNKSLNHEKFLQTRPIFVSHISSFLLSTTQLWNSLPVQIPAIRSRASFSMEVNHFLGATASASSK